MDTPPPQTFHARKLLLAPLVSALCLLTALLPAADLDKVATERLDGILEGELQKQSLVGSEYPVL